MSTPVHTWSKVVLIASTCLVAYTLAALALPHIAHHVRFHHGGTSESNGPHPHPHGHHHAPCDVHHFLLLGLFTGLTGMYAAFNAHRRCTSVYIALLLVLQLTGLGVLSHRATHAYHRCLSTSEEYTVTTRVAEYSAPGIRVVTAYGERTPTGLDVDRLNQCNRHVYHVFLVASAVVGVIVLCMMHCALRLHRAVQIAEDGPNEEGCDEEIEHDEGVVMVVGRVKADPLAEDTPQGVIVV